MTGLKEEDLRMETFSNGTGFVALRLIHLPTGYSVEIRDEKSRLQAAKKARTMLAERVKEAER